MRFIGTFPHGEASYADKSYVSALIKQAKQLPDELYKSLM